MGVLSGLSDLGLGQLENLDIYDSESNNKAVIVDPTSQEKSVIPDESELIYDKKYTCPVCGKEFVSKTVRSSKARLIRQDKDLKPIFNYIDPSKYDVISCTKCGYSSVDKWFGKVSGKQIELIKANICANYKEKQYGDVYSYDDAIERYKLALATCIVKRGNNSEKGYTCLKYAWTVRGKREELEEIGELDSIIEEYADDEKELLHNAFEGLKLARENERLPIAGMDSSTLDYLMAVIMLEEGNLEDAAKYVLAILQSKVAGNRIKEKARDLKEEILEAKNKSEQ